MRQLYNEVSTENEITNILDFIVLNPHIPESIAESIRNKQIEGLADQLRKQQITDELIPTLKSELERIYYDSLIPPGESVGIICAQSIGEKQTQTS